MADLHKMIKELVKFRKERNWEQFHSPKNQAISLALEASELLEIFQWQDSKPLEVVSLEQKERLKEELIDVLSWVLLISHDQNIDIEKSFYDKLAKNGAKYPVEKCFGSSSKYDKL